MNSSNDKESKNDSNPLNGIFNDILNESKEESSSNSSVQSQSIRNSYLKGEIPEFVFSVIKLGRRGFSHKSRLLYITKDGISYYRMLENNENTKDFLEYLKNIYTVKPGDRLEPEKLRELVNKFNNIPEEEKQLKFSFKKYIISISGNASTFTKAPITVKNSEEKDYTNPTNFWVMETKDERFRELILKVPYIINDAIYALNSKKEKGSKNDYGKKLKNDDKLKEFAKDEKMVVLNEYKDKIKYIELMYQGFMKEYLKTICEVNKKKRTFIDKSDLNKMDQNDKEKKEVYFVENNNLIKQEKKISNKNDDINVIVNDESRDEFIGDTDLKDKEKNDYNLLEEKINDTLKIVYLELAIYYCYDLFVKYCEKVVEKIVYHLGTFDKAEDMKRQIKHLNSNLSLR